MLLWCNCQWSLRHNIVLRPKPVCPKVSETNLQHFVWIHSHSDGRNLDAGGKLLIDGRRQFGRTFGGKVDDEPALTTLFVAPNDEYCFVFLLDGLKRKQHFFNIFYSTIFVIQHFSFVFNKLRTASHLLLAHIYN